MKKSKNKKHPKWIASDKFKGVRYYTDKSRKHGSRFDTFYGIRYQINNKRYEYNLGYASQGWTEQKAALEIEKYKIASDQGTGAISKTEQRQINRRKRLEQAKLDEEEKRRRELRSVNFLNITSIHKLINRQILFWLKSTPL